MYFIQTNNDGKIVGRYIQGLHTIPVGCIEVDEDLFHDSMNISNGEMIYKNGSFVREMSPIPTLSDKKEQSKMIVDNLKSEREKQGFSYQFPTGIDTIQIRDERDLININGLVTTAILLKQTNSEEILPFITESNTTHQLTLDEVISMGVTVSSFIQSLTTKARQYKDSITNAKSKKAVDDILSSISWE